jgi:hypothetical protein
MTKVAKRELLEAVRPRYLQASKREKGRILDEFTAVTGYHRKYAIHLLRNGPPKRGRKRVGRRWTYGPEVVAALVRVWEVSGHLCGKRLQPFLPELVAALQRHGELNLAPGIKAQLLRMSAATIDRRLKRARSRLPRRGRSTTKPGSLLKDAIPIRTFADWDEKQPGFVEMDLVAHCGESTAGEYLNTLCAVDIDTRWCELLALPNKGQRATFQGIQALRMRLPFPLLGVDSDSGSEFINHHLYHYCQRERITFTRSRPFRKNDQAHVEQKNWSAVRQTIGYERYESPEALVQLETIYTDLRLSINFFQPVMKLVGKTRVGSKVHRRYDTAQTPYQRAMASPHIDQEVKEQLCQLYLTLNPAALQRRISAHLEQLWTLER